MHEREEAAIRKAMMDQFERTADQAEAAAAILRRAQTRSNARTHHHPGQPVGISDLGQELA